MKAILTCICRALGCDEYEPAVGTWAHKTCNGWNAQIHREYMGLPTNFRDRLGDVIQDTSCRIQELLQARHVRINAALSSLAEHGAETGEEAQEKESLLYDFWAVYRALGGNE